MPCRCWLPGGRSGGKLRSVASQAAGAPAGIEEFAETRMVAEFSLRPHLWHGYTDGYTTV